VTGDRPDDPGAEIRRLESEVAQRPSDGEAWQHLCVVLRKANRLEEAARAGWRAIELLPGWETWMTLGHVFLKAGNMRAALAAYEKSAETAPDHDLVARNFLNVGYRAWGFADFAGAEKAYRRAAAASDENALVHSDLANLYASSGRFDEARAEATRAIALIDALPIGKLPSQGSRTELEVMRTLLNDVLAGHPVALPPPTESGQVLPQRFIAQPPHGQAVALKIDPMTMRMYPLDENQMFALTVPSNWVETMTCQKGRTDIRLAPGSGNRSMVLLVTGTAPSAEFTPRAAAERSASTLRSSGSARVGPLQPIALPSGEAYWFWSADPTANPNNPRDYPFLAQLTGRYEGVAISATMLLFEDSPESRQLLPLLAGMISAHRLQHPTADPQSRPPLTGPPALGPGGRTSP
jgi:tetratricopeptide (TPR) repeat protein